MSPLDALTGSQIRSQAILSIVQEAIADGNCTLEHVATKTDRFPNFGEIGADEFAAAVELLRPAEFEPDAEPITAEPTGVATTPVPEMTRDQAIAHLNGLKDALHLARQERMKCDADVQSCRAAMATAIGQWNAQGGGYTREMLVRDTIKANQQRKQDIRDGKVAPRSRHDHRIADSYFDRVDSFGRGDANSFVRRGHTPGQPWRGGTRGAFPASYQNAPAKIHGEK